MSLNKEVFAEMKKLVGYAIDTYADQIEKAYYNTEGKFTVTFKGTIEPDEVGEKVGCNVSFVKEKVKGSFSEIVEKATQDESDEIED